MWHSRSYTCIPSPGSVGWGRRAGGRPPWALLVLAMAACEPEAQRCDDARCATDTADPFDDEELPDTPEPPDAPIAPELQDRDGDGYSPADGDCDDDDDRAFPGAVETCDGVDNDCNGFVDEGLDRMLVQASDYGANGIYNSLTYTIYDAGNRLIRRETDTNADGFINVVESYNYVYDGNGKLLAQETDAGDDGTVDSIRTYIYDGNGRLIGMETDDGADGVLDRIDTYHYDDNGRRVRWDVDLAADGTIDMVYHYTHDPLTGRLVQMVLDRFDAEGVLTQTSIYTYAYTASGKQAQTWIDSDGDGVDDTTTIYHYDEVTGLMVRVETDAGVDGVIDSSTLYKYDAKGMVEVIEIDQGADGSPDTRITRWETCSDPK